MKELMMLKLMMRKRSTEGDESAEECGGETERDFVVIDFEDEEEGKGEGQSEIDASHNLSNKLVAYFRCPCCKIPAIMSFDMCVTDMWYAKYAEKN